MKTLTAACLLALSLCLGCSGPSDPCPDCHDGQCCQEPKGRNGDDPCKCNPSCRCKGKCPCHVGSRCGLRCRCISKR